MKKNVLFFSAVLVLGTATAQTITQDFENPLSSPWVGQGAIVGSQGGNLTPRGGGGMYDLTYSEELYVAVNLPAATNYISLWIYQTDNRYSSITTDLQDANGNFIRSVGTNGTGQSGYWQYQQYQLGAGFNGNSRILFKRNYTDNSVAANSSYLDDISVSGFSATSVVETISANDFKLYPNPAQEKLNLVFRADIANLSIDIMDVTGKIVHSEKNAISLAANENKEINLSHLNAGVYFCKIQNDKSSFVQKVVIE